MAEPLAGLNVILKEELFVKPSTSFAVISAVIAPPSSSPVPDVPPVTTVGSSTALTVTVISWVSVFWSSSVIVTVKVSVPLKCWSGV